MWKSIVNVTGSLKILRKIPLLLSYKNDTIFVLHFSPQYINLDQWKISRGSAVLQRQYFVFFFFSLFSFLNDVPLMIKKKKSKSNEKHREKAKTRSSCFCHCQSMHMQIL